MSTGVGMLDLARQHIGESYENVQVPKNNPNWHGPWDCAEFMSWVVYQDVGLLYGCINDSVNPATADAYTGSWQVDSVHRGIRIPVERAAAIAGGILLRFPPEPGAMGHIAICDGRGGTVEAKGHAFGVVADVVQGRRWDTGVLIPGAHYDTDITPLNLLNPAKVYFIGGPDMSSAVVREIQLALLARGFNPGPIDGIYGEKTAGAVGAFQQSKGLVMDGEVGRETARELEVEL